MNNSVYIVLTQTYSLVSRIISIFAKNKYSHVSLCFDEACTKMYSFGRKYDYLAFYGVFKEENINTGLFIKNKNSLMAIYKLNVTPYQYKKIKRKVEEIKNNNRGYNLIGLFLVMLNIKLNRNKYYCSEFVNEVLSCDKVRIMNNSNKVVKPEDFKNIDGLKLLYEGKICDYDKRLKIG